MTVQPTRGQLLDMTEDLGVLGDRPELCDEVVDGLWAALDRAEAQVSEERRLRMKATAAATRAEARVEAAQEKAWEECAAMAAHHGDFDGSRTRWLSSINPYSITEKEKEA